MSSPEDPPSIDEVLRHYPVGPVLDWQRLGGTAGASVRIRTDRGLFVIRRRGQRTSAAEHVAFDAAFRRFLRGRGVPAVAPVLTIDGTDGVSSADGFWELSEYEEGRPHRPADAGQVRGLARTLANLHRVSREFRAQRTWDRPLRQFELAAPGVPSSPRIDDPRSMRAGLELVLQGLDAAARQTVERMRRLVDAVEAAYSGPAYDPLDRYVIHGDLHPSNLLFEEDDGVRALFDFDWSAPAPRVRDLADAIWFFAGAPLRPGADIWALTADRDGGPEPGGPSAADLCLGGADRGRGGTCHPVGLAGPLDRNPPGGNVQGLPGGPRPVPDSRHGRDRGGDAVPGPGSAPAAPVPLVLDDLAPRHAGGHEPPHDLGVGEPCDQRPTAPAGQDPGHQERGHGFRLVP